MSFVRQLENRVFARVRDPQAAAVATADATDWNPAALRGHKYCLLTSYRASGRAVSTPVWFGLDSQRIFIRSGAEDGKVKRIRRSGEVLVAPCGSRGRPLGPPMRGSARILGTGEQEHAEAVLRSSYGLGRKLYRLVRRRINVEYLEVSAPPGRPEPPLA